MSTFLTLNWKKDVLLAPYTTYRIGGAAKYFISIQTIDELKKAIQDCLALQLPFYVLGKGSNSLFDDRGYNGAVILNEIDFCDQKGDFFEVGSGAFFPSLGFQTAKKGFSGLEFAAGIPGTVGGAIYMNAGAHGQEMKDVLHSVCFISDQAKESIFKKEEMTFDYRYSSFHKLKGVIASAVLKLTYSDQAREIQKQHLLKRQASQPLKDKSCGCVFRNPAGESIGLLIDQLGLKGMRVGDAQISLKHGNFIVNRGKARASDVLELMKQIETKIYEERGLHVIREVRYVPYEAF